LGAGFTGIRCNIAEKSAGTGILALACASKPEIWWWANLKARI